MIGTEFAGRHEQYEKFYGGASFLVKQNMARAYDFAGATQAWSSGRSTLPPDLSVNEDIAKPGLMLDKSRAEYEDRP